MFEKMPVFLSRIMPYFIAGILIVLAILGVIVLSYVFLWGVLIGGILYFVIWMKNKLFPSKKPADTEQFYASYRYTVKKDDEGEIIDYKEIQEKSVASEENKTDDKKD